MYPLALVQGPPVGGGSVGQAQDGSPPPITNGTEKATKWGIGQGVYVFDWRSLAADRQLWDPIRRSHAALEELVDQPDLVQGWAPHPMRVPLPERANEHDGQAPEGVVRRSLEQLVCCLAGPEAFLHRELVL